MPVSFELPSSMQAVTPPADVTPAGAAVQEIGQTLPTELSRNAVLGAPVNGHGIAAHADLQSLSADFTIERIHLTTEGRTLVGA